jgi:hypothetical protein
VVIRAYRSGKLIGRSRHEKAALRRLWEDWLLLTGPAGSGAMLSACAEPLQLAKTLPGHRGRMPR